jgi:hypothetical protein
MFVIPECFYRGSSFIRQLESGFRLKACRNDNFLGFLQEAQITAKHSANERPRACRCRGLFVFYFTIHPLPFTLYHSRLFESHRITDVLRRVRLGAAVAALHRRFVGKAADQLDVVGRVERAHMLLVVFAFASHGFLLLADGDDSLLQVNHIPVRLQSPPARGACGQLKSLTRRAINCIQYAVDRRRFRATASK